MKNHTNRTTPDSRSSFARADRGRRGGTGLLVLGGLAGAALIVFLAIDLDAIERDRSKDALAAQFEAYRDARSAEDAEALVALFTPSSRASFDAERIGLRWDFEGTDVLEVGEPTLDVRWDTGRARVTAEARVAIAPVVDAEGGADGEANDAAEVATHALEQKWALLDGTWYLVPGDEPWGLERLEVVRQLRRQRFDERFEQYREVRLKDDQQALYSMYTAADRAETDLGRYLSIYGHGVMKVHAIDLVEVELDADGDTAESTFELDSELVLRNASPAMRSALRDAKPEDLRGRSAYPQVWHWEDGDWYLEMEKDPTKVRQAAPPVPPGSLPGPGPMPGPRPAASESDGR